MNNIDFLRKRTVIISYLVFFLGWTLRVKYINLSDMNEYLSWAIGFLIHLAWWPLFAFVLINKYSNKLNVSLKEMITTKPKLKILMPLLAFTVVYNLAGYFINKDGFGTSMKLYDLIVTVATVGIFEESLFRGWFLNSISTFVSERKANLISSALFMLIHYPGWIVAGYKPTTIITTSIAVFVLGLLFGWTFRKNRSIWSCVIIHSAWDLMTWIL